MGNFRATRGAFPGKARPLRTGMILLLKQTMTDTSHMVIVLHYFTFSRFKKKKTYSKRKRRISTSPHVCTTLLVLGGVPYVHRICVRFISSVARFA